jgi:hypothetical protein
MHNKKQADVSISWRDTSACFSFCFLAKQEPSHLRLFKRFAVDLIVQREEFAASSSLTEKTFLRRGGKTSRFRYEKRRQLPSTGVQQAGRTTRRGSHEEQNRRRQVGETHSIA